MLAWSRTKNGVPTFQESRERLHWTLNHNPSPSAEVGQHAGGGMTAQTKLHPALGDAAQCDMLCTTFTAVAALE